MYIFVNNVGNIVVMAGLSYIEYNQHHVVVDCQDGIRRRFPQEIYDYSIIQVDSLPEDYKPYGYIYDNNTFTKKYWYKNTFTKLEFFQKLTDEEQIKLIQYEEHIDNTEPDPIDNKTKKNAMRLLWEKIHLMEGLDLTHSCTSEFCQITQWCGIFSAERSLELIQPEQCW